MTHVFPDDSAGQPGGVYRVTATAVDEDASDHPATDIQVTVSNVEPTPLVAGSTGAVEGSNYSLTLYSILDPGDDIVSEVVIDWGDGSPIQSGVAVGDTLSHVYDDDGQYDVTIQLTDEDGAHPATVAVSADIRNVAPLLSWSGPRVADEGELYTLDLASVFDPGNDTVSHVEIFWGDAPTPTQATVPGQATHTYLEGDYTIEVHVIDEDGDHRQNETIAVEVRKPGRCRRRYADAGTGRGFRLRERPLAGDGDARPCRPDGCTTHSHQQ